MNKTCALQPFRGSTPPPEVELTATVSRQVFEFFLAAKHSPRYWEFNLSPSGHWNIYSFAVYRQGMQEETAFTSLLLAVHRQSHSLSLNLEAGLGQIIGADQAAEIAISAVIQGRDGQATFWALAHCGPQADFHRRGSFVVEL